jgi:hypothetical protein
MSGSGLLLSAVDGEPVVDGVVLKDMKIIPNAVNASRHSTVLNVYPSIYLLRKQTRGSGAYLLESLRASGWFLDIGCLDFGNGDRC